MTEEIMFTPVFDRILVEREVKKETKSGIIIPDAVQKKYSATKGKIIKCGHTVDPAIAQLIGKVVYFARFSGDWIAIDDEEKYFILSDEDVLGVAEDVEFVITGKDEE